MPMYASGHSAARLREPDQWGPGAPARPQQDWSLKLELATRSTTALEQFTTHLKQHYYQPDIEAIEIVLAVVAAHYVLDADPIWLFLEGPPGTGKTEMGITPLYGLPDAIPLGDITPNTFLSGRADHGDHKASLLQQGGSSILFTIKDFTTMMSKRPDVRAEIISQMREIYDGQFVKNTGMGNAVSWKGKVTMIAAVTPAIEREWALLRDLGERFMTVRWERGNGVEMARRAINRSVSRHAVSRQSGELVQMLMRNVRTVGKLGSLPESLSEPIVHMAEFGATARCRVIRDSSGKREIIDIPQPEAPTRFSSALSNAISAYALLKGRAPILEDLRIAQRLLFDSIARTRVRLLTSIPPDTSIEHCDLIKLTGMPASTILWVGRELEALGLITIATITGADTFEYTERGRGLLTKFSHSSYH